MLIGINQLKELRSNVSVEIEAEREINKKLTDEITALNERLIKSQNNLNALEESKEAYSKSIEECELVCECLIHFCMFLVHFKGFINTDQHRKYSTIAQSDNKINESSQNLLNVLRRDSKTIQKNLETMKLS
jgi:hypothetical protein